MKPVSRRDMLKAGLLAPAVAAAHGLGPISAAAIQAAQKEPASLPIGEATESAKPGAGRERFLLDFGWRFHFGNANDAAKDLGFGGGQSGNFQKTGNFIAASSLAFDDGDWRAVDLPHDWAIELPFANDPALTSKGFYPLGRKLSGDQRRLVSPRVRDSCRGCGQTDHHRVRRRVPGNDGCLQRLLHRAAQRRI